MVGAPWLAQQSRAAASKPGTPGPETRRKVAKDEQDALAIDAALGVRVSPVPANGDGPGSLDAQQSKGWSTFFLVSEGAHANDTFDCPTGRRTAEVPPG